MSSNKHQHYMSFALQLAEQGRNTASPNPMVGCVIVKNNRMIGTGYHQRAGEAHAEIIALQQAGKNAQNATMYVTLEPCCHFGKTPPCTSAIIQAGIKKIYIACVDPNQLVNQKGMHELRSAGIDIEVGLCEAEAKKLNEIFFHYIQYKRPFVIAKWAMSLDGKTITHIDDTRSISCETSQQFSHQTRQQVDAILIGSKTAIQDNPLLTDRYHESAKQPMRIILSSKGDLPLDLQVFDQSLAKTIVATTDMIKKSTSDALLAKNIEVLILPKNKLSQINLISLLNELGARKITSLLVEGGMTVNESFIRENLVNRIHVYLAPVIISDLKKKKILSNMNGAKLERDFFFTADCSENIYV